jgi:hypothetical protein
MGRNYDQFPISAITSGERINSSGVLFTLQQRFGR